MYIKCTIQSHVQQTAHILRTTAQLILNYLFPYVQLYHYAHLYVPI